MLTNLLCTGDRPNPNTNPTTAEVEAAEGLLLLSQQPARQLQQAPAAPSAPRNVQPAGQGGRGLGGLGGLGEHGGQGRQGGDGGHLGNQGHPHPSSPKRKRSSDRRPGSQSPNIYKRVRRGSSSPSEPSSHQSSRFPWNNIVPVASRSVTVGNRAHHTNPRVVDTPTTASRMRPQQRIERVWGLRRLLGEPVGVSEDELTRTLDRHDVGWDLGRALRAFNAELNRARDQQIVNAPTRNQLARMRDRVLGADSLHHNRRLGVNYLYERLTMVREFESIQQMTTLTLGNALLENDFDVDAAVRALVERYNRDSNGEDLQRQLVTERRQRMPTLSQLHMDRRVAHFMGVAGTDDFHAALSLSQQYGYDMHRVLDHWMQHGLPHANVPQDALTRQNFVRGVLDHDDMENLWPAPRQLAARVDETQITDEDRADVAATYGDSQHGYDAVRGQFVRYPRRQAYSGIDLPPRRQAAFVYDGRYGVLSYDFVPVTGQKGTKAAFDHNNVDHVKKWNAQSSQWHRRYTGMTLHSKAALFTEDENTWIYDWHNERLLEALFAHPVLQATMNGREWDRAGLEWPMRIDPQRLMQDFNAYATSNGRPHRTMAALESARRRIRALCRDFGLSYAPPHGPRKRNQPTASDDEEDQASDGEED